MDLITASQANKETVINEALQAVEPASVFGMRTSTTNLLTWGYYGGQAWLNGALTTIPAGTLVLSASATNYIESNSSGVVSKNTTGFNAGSLALYEVTTDGTSITAITDKRFSYGIFASAMALPTFMGVRASLSTALTAINTSAGYKIPFNAESYDTNSFHSTVTNNTRITIPAGLGITRAIITAMTRIESITAGTALQFYLFKNGSVFSGPIGEVDSAGTERGLIIDTGVIDVIAGDYFEAHLVCGDTSVTISNAFTYFSLQVVEATRLDQHRSLFASPASSAGVLNIDLTAYEYFKTTLTENVTSVTFTGTTSGLLNRFEIRVAQDATGGRTWANPASWKFPGGTAYTPSAGANAVDIIKGRTYDNGTTWQIEFQKGYA